MNNKQSTPVSPGLKSHIVFIGLNFMFLCMVFTLLRAGLLAYNHELIGNTTTSDFLEAFFNGLRFDFRAVVFALLPLTLAMLSPWLIRHRAWQKTWLLVITSVIVFLGLVEFDFYREFHQRLNALVFQYIEEDPATVLSMIWHGYPVVRYLAMWLVFTLGIAWLINLFSNLSFKLAPDDRMPALHWRVLTFFLCVLLFTLMARGTLRQGPPLRWGDASTTDSIFANQLGLNGILTLADAAKARMSEHSDNHWISVMPEEEATQLVRRRLLSSGDQLIDDKLATVRRITTPLPANELPVKNVVVILLESFSGQFVGSLGGPEGITPNFDRLSKQGLLFTNFFANGTHTHQGMFATMACFPNLPGFEYLMQSPQGSYNFSGLPQLLSNRNFNDVYVYNGDFAWDNQRGFFGNQGMSNFIGRFDYINPVFSDSTWGVSDQDMFDRAHEELLQLDGEQPFYALLQTLSNHTPYALPDPLPVKPVQGFGSLDEHLTAMRYADWALGQFFEKAQKSPYYKDTLFVVVGDHGFGSATQLTDIDLYRFHVPMLLLGPNVLEQFGQSNDIVGTQLDIVPTIMGRLGGEVQHQCWGRDLLNLAENDKGFGVIKPSGSDQTVALLEGEKIYILPRDGDAKVYQYQLHNGAYAKLVKTESKDSIYLTDLKAFLQTATTSLLANKVGWEDKSQVSEGNSLVAQQADDAPSKTEKNL